MSKLITTIESRFWQHVLPEPNSGCWLWTGDIDRRGYGRISSGGRGGKKIYAHRASLCLHGTDIPDGLCVLHKCDVPACVNPGHLFVGTVADNIADMDRKGRRNRDRKHMRGRPHLYPNHNDLKTHCIHGHPLSGNNLLASNRGARVCRECVNTRAALYRKRNRAGSLSLRECE